MEETPSSDVLPCIHHSLKMEILATLFMKDEDTHTHTHWWGGQMKYTKPFWPSLLRHNKQSDYCLSSLKYFSGLCCQPQTLELWDKSPKFCFFSTYKLKKIHITFDYFLYYIQDSWILTIETRLFQNKQGGQLHTEQI